MWQVPSNAAGSSGAMHRRTSSWQSQQLEQQLQNQQPQLHQQQVPQGQSSLVSRGSDSTLGGYATALSEAPSSCSDGGQAGATSLANVRQHLRNISAQSLSGFSDTGTPVSQAADRLESARDRLAGLPPHVSGAQRGPHGVHRDVRDSPAVQAAAGADPTGARWGGLGGQNSGRSNSDPSKLFCCCPVLPVIAVTSVTWF